MPMSHYFFTYNNAFTNDDSLFKSKKSILQYKIDDISHSNCHLHYLYIT